MVEPVSFSFRVSTVKIVGVPKFRNLMVSFYFSSLVLFLSVGSQDSLTAF